MIGAVGARVEVLEILAHNDVEVAWPGDQDVVEAFAAQSRCSVQRSRSHARQVGCLPAVVAVGVATTSSAAACSAAKARASALSW